MILKKYCILYTGKIVHVYINLTNFELYSKIDRTLT